MRRPRIKAWKRLRLLLSGARRLTWLYRVPRERVLEPENVGCSQPSPALPCALPGPTPSWLTWLHRRLHHAPGAAPALPGDEVLPERLQPVRHQGVEGRAEGGQHQVPHIRAQPAITQLGLEVARCRWLQRSLQPPPANHSRTPRGAPLLSSSQQPPPSHLHLLHQVPGGPEMRDDFINGGADGYQKTWEEREREDARRPRPYPGLPEGRGETAFGQPESRAGGEGQFIRKRGVGSQGALPFFCSCS